MSDSQTRVFITVTTPLAPSTGATLPRVGVIVALGELLRAEGNRDRAAFLFDEPFSEAFWQTVQAAKADVGRLSDDWQLLTCSCTASDPPTLVLAIHPHGESVATATQRTSASLGEPEDLIAEVIAFVERHTSVIREAPRDEHCAERDPRQLRIAALYAPLNLQASRFCEQKPQDVCRSIALLSAELAPAFASVADREIFLFASVDLAVLAWRVKADAGETTAWTTEDCEGLATELLGHLDRAPGAGSSPDTLALARAHLLWTLSRIDEAAACFRVATSAQPAYASYMCAALFLSQGRLEESSREIERGLAAIGPENPPFPDLSYAARHDPDLADRTYRELFLQMRAQMLLLNEDLRGAIATCEEAVTCSARPIHALRILAAAQQRRAASIEPLSPETARELLYASVETMRRIFDIEPAMAEVRSALTIAQRCNDEALAREWVAKVQA